MKIWYQSYADLSFDSRWKKYKEDLKNYVGKVARQDTKVDVHGVKKMSPNLIYSKYVQFMHVPQVINNALQAEREGYDAFCVGGTLDPGHEVLREVLDIPVAFITESSLYNACLLGRKFGMIGVNEVLVRMHMELVTFHGLENRCLPAEHLGYSALLDVVELSENNPQQLIDLVTEAGRKVIARGAGALLLAFGGLNSFFGEQGIHNIDGIPIVDMIAAVIKTAEIMVDLDRIGVKRSRKGFNTYASKDDLMEARKLYGVV